MALEGVSASSERLWALRFTSVSVLSGVSAVVAHLIAGGTVGSVLGLVLGFVGSMIVSMIALYRPGFLRTVLAMSAGQYSFHLFLGVGATSGHHHAVATPLVADESAMGMGAAHLMAAFGASVVIAGASRALGLLRGWWQMLQHRARCITQPLLATEILLRWVSPNFFPVLRAEGRQLVGSHGLRGPPAFA